MTRSRQITMNISLDKDESTNVFQDSSWPLFDEERASRFVTPVPEIGLVSFVARQLEYPIDIQALDEACSLELAPLLFHNPSLTIDYKVWLFIAHSSWQPKSRVVLFKGLKRSMSDPMLQMFHFREHMIESSEGVRFAGIAEVTPETFMTSIQLLRGYSAFLLVSNRSEIQNDASVDFIFRSAFPLYKGIEQGKVDLMVLSIYLCPLGDIVIRVSGTEDEKSASLDCAMLSEKVSLFDEKHNT